MSELQSEKASPVKHYAADENAVSHRRKDEAVFMNGKEITDGSIYLAWIEKFAAKHFTCGLCNDTLTNPKLLAGTPASAPCVCHDCAKSQGLGVVDAPISIVGAAADIKNFLFLQHGEMNEEKARKKTAARSSNALLTSPGVGELNPNTDPPARKEQSPGRQLFVDAHALPSPSEQKAAKAEIIPKHRAQLLALMDEEMGQRATILDEHTTSHLEMQRTSSVKLKSLRSTRTGCSKQVKMEADDHYEKGNYAQAVAMYSKAIALSVDGTTRLNVLLGNRSAALFMAQDYAQCVDDCVKVTLTEPANVKLYSRAIKAAVMMGDLEKAAQVHTLVDPQYVTSQMQTEYNKIVQAIDDLKEANRKHGTPDGDRMWERLMTKFSETHVFRMQLADSVAAQSNYTKAIDLLSLLTAPNRPPGVAYRIAKYRYMSGFEHFDAAKSALQEFLQDAQCAKMLALIKAVDEAKQDGNNLFATRNFAASVDQYTKAIELDLTNGKILRILYCNRAAAFKELSRFQEGVDDCTRAIDLDPAFGKAYARRARCLMLQKNYDGAARDFRAALQHDPSDKDIAKELKNAEEAIAKEIEKEKDFFYVLDIDSRTTDVEMKTKYRALCLRWHPDKNADKSADEKLVAERKFKALNEAYSTLSNPEKRREYELKRDRERYANINRASTATANAAKYTRTRHTGGTAAPGGYGSYNSNTFW